MPTLTLQPDATDGVDTHIIDGSYSNLNYGTSTQAPIGHQHVLGVDVNCRGLYRFSLAELPSGSTVTSATLTLYITGGTFTDHSEFYCKLLGRTDWVESQATWNIYKTGSNWTTAGGDIQAGVSTITSYVDTVDTEISFSIGSLVTAAIGLGRTNVDLVVSSINSMPILPEYDQFTNVYSSDETTAALRPKLVIVTSENYTIQAAQIYTAGAIGGDVK